MVISVATEEHLKHAEAICEMIADAAKKRGTGIAKRNPEYLRDKIRERKAVIATDQNKPVGFCYIESWEGNKFVANSGLIVSEQYRKTGLAKMIKAEILRLSVKKFPESKVFGITTSLAVMKINSDLGYKPVTFSELTDDELFWNGCKGCVNYDILQRNNQNNCLCTAMIYKPKKEPKIIEKNVRGRWENFQRFLKLRKIRIQKKYKLNIEI